MLYNISVRTKLIIGSIGVIILFAIGWHYVQTRFYASDNPSFAAPSNWKTYTDPDGLFSLRIPPDWTASLDGGGVLGDFQSSDQLSMTTYRFQAPKTNTDFYAPVMQIKVTIGSWSSNSQRQSMCLHRLVHLPSTQPYQVGSLMADDSNGTINLYTQKAFAMITFYYPGEKGVISSSPNMRFDAPTPTPITSAAITKGQQTIVQILSTFQAHPNQSGC